MKERLVNLLKLLVALGLLYWLFRKLEDPTKLWQQIANANKLLLLLGAACYASAVAISALKWGVLLNAIEVNVTPGRLLSYQWIAEFFNNFLPAQVGGDVMRGYALAVDTQRAAVAAASILIDRFIGLAVFMVAAAGASLAMLLWGRPNGTMFTGDALFSLRLITLGSVAVAVLLCGMLIALLSRRLKQLVEWLLAHLPLASRLLPIWHKLADAFNAYRYAYRALLLSALGSVLIVLLTSVNIWLIARSITPGAISLAEVLAINPMIVFVALVVPLSPGGLGVRQGAFYATFLLIGASGTLGFAVGLLQQCIGYVISLPGGLLWVRGRTKSALPKPTVLPSETPVGSR